MKSSEVEEEIYRMGNAYPTSPMFQENPKLDV